MPIHISSNTSVVTELPNSERPIIFSHNFCDKTTWYGKSTRVTGETLDVISGTDNKEFQADNDFWIDLSHGKISDEDNISSSYLPVVKVDGVIKTEATPFGDNTDGDFYIDYEDGKVIFHNSITGTVTADYSYAGNSIFTMAPYTGRVLHLVKAEAQLSSDLVLNDTLLYSIYVGETLVKQKKYKTIMDYVNESNRAYPTIPVFGGNRGYSSPVHVFMWDYVARTELYASCSMRMEARLENDVVCGGQCAMVSFYTKCLSEG